MLCIFFPLFYACLVDISPYLNMQLLGKDCYDIDIAIDNMLGREFCEKINEYLSKSGEDIQGVGVIQRFAQCGKYSIA